MRLALAASALALASCATPGEPAPLSCQGMEARAHQLDRDRRAVVRQLRDAPNDIRNDVRRLGEQLAAIDAEHRDLAERRATCGGARGRS